MRGQAAVVGDTLFLPMADNNRLFALDISTDKPCVQWVYDGGRSMRTSAGYGEMSNGQKIVMVGDMGGFVHAIDAKTGKKMWEADVKFFQNQMVTSTPVLYKDRVYAPISQYELPAAAANSYVCCMARGGITALDAKTGKKIWAQATMPEAQPLKDRGDGQFIWGPSGAPIWNSASLDQKRNRLYVGTGEANSGPAHPNTDALLSSIWTQARSSGATRRRRRTIQSWLLPGREQQELAGARPSIATSTSAPRPSSPRRPTGRNSSSAGRSPARSGR